MRPNNEFTSPENRFFYPVNNPVEHYESVDTAGFPAVILAGGRDHFIVTEKDGQETAADPYWNRSNIPEGSVVKEIAVITEGSVPARLPDILEEEDHLALLDRANGGYRAETGDQVVVKLNRDIVWRNRDNEAISGDGIFILPLAKPLPSTAELGLPDNRELYYEFIGFIDSQDHLVVPNYLSWCPLRKAVDWCIANQLSQNRLEQALLRDDLPRESSLTGMLKVEPKLAAYLTYFDAKHGTNILPTEDPKRHYDRFPPLTETQRERYIFLSEAAHRFLREPRS